MAVIKTKKIPTVMDGGLKREFYSFNLNGESEGSIVTSGKNVLSCNYTNRVNEAQGLVHLNFSDAGTTVADGTLFLSGFTSTDDILDIEVVFI